MNDLFADSATEKLVERSISQLTDGVMQRTVDPGLCRRIADQARFNVEHDRLDIENVPAGDKRVQNIQCGFYASIAVAHMCRVFGIAMTGNAAAGPHGDDVTVDSGIVRARKGPIWILLPLN